MKGARLGWSVDNRMYFLQPTYRLSATGRVWVTGAELYDYLGIYKGYWYRHNMPIACINACARHVKDGMLASSIGPRSPHRAKRR